MNEIKPWHTVIKKRRLKLPASLAELGYLLGEPKSILCSVENRTKVAPFRIICKLCEYFNTLPEDIFDSNGFALKLSDIEADERQINFAFGGVQ